MWLVILVVVLAIGMTCVKIGSVAFRMTGLDQQTSSFQALSAFTGTGFTTREAETITRDRRRRRIASGLMIAGNAGFAVTLVALFQAFDTFGKADSFLDVLLRVAIAALGLLLLYNLAWGKWLNTRLTRFIERRLAKATDLSMPHFEQMLKIGEGYGISEIRIREDHPAIGKSLADVDWSKMHVLVLAIQRQNEMIKSPSAVEQIQEGDNLTCFGPAGVIRRLAQPDELTKSGRFPKVAAPSGAPDGPGGSEPPGIA